MMMHGTASDQLKYQSTPSRPEKIFLLLFTIYSFRLIFLINFSIEMAFHQIKTLHRSFSFSQKKKTKYQSLIILVLLVHVYNFHA
jgi:hypothetical protein